MLWGSPSHARARELTTGARRASILALQVPFKGSHLPERFGLFTIIILGELIISLSNAASEDGTLTAEIWYAVGSAATWP